MPDCKRFRLSFENVENVVNPPQNPTVNRRLSCEGELSRFNIGMSNPISKQPAILAVIVAQG